MSDASDLFANQPLIATGDPPPQAAEPEGASAEGTKAADKSKDASAPQPELARELRKACRQTRRAIEEQLREARQTLVHGPASGRPRVT